MIRYICAQPAEKLFLWQVEVMIVNFMEMGINPNHIDIVCSSQGGERPRDWQELANKYPARFFFYPDTRMVKNYTSSIRPNILKQHFQAHPYLFNDAIFYHDCDIVFTNPVKNWLLPEFIQDDTCYGSDTRSYISYSYIKSKGHEVIERMCQIMDLPEELIKLNEENSIGAQYILKGIDWSFWERVEKDCEELFVKITAYNNELISIENKNWEAEKAASLLLGKEYIEPKYNPVQIWCADMWAVLWGLWRLGKRTAIHKNLEFSWASWKVEDYYRMNIHHNAGVVSDNLGYFYKSKYREIYPDLTLEVKPSANGEYYKLIKRVAENSVIREYYTQ